MLTNAIIMEDIYALSDVQIQTKIGEKIKATRLKQNITQESLAESALTSRSSVQKVESGEIKSFDTFLRILRTLVCQPRSSVLYLQDPRICPCSAESNDFLLGEERGAEPTAHRKVF